MPPPPTTATAPVTPSLAVPAPVAAPIAPPVATPTTPTAPAAPSSVMFGVKVPGGTIQFKTKKEADAFRKANGLK